VERQRASTGQIQAAPHSKSFLACSIIRFLTGSQHTRILILLWVEVEHLWRRTFFGRIGEVGVGRLAAAVRSSDLLAGYLP